MSTPPTRPNYFELLGLDPNKPWNEAEFKSTLTAKRAEWTKLARNPKNAKLYTSYTEMVPKIEVLMADPEQRKQEAERAKKLLDEKGREGLAQFKADLDLMASKGYLSVSEVDSLVKKYAGQLTEAAIQQEIKTLRIEVRSTATDGSTAPKLEELDSSMMKGITTNLELVKKQDLYDFFDKKSSTGTAELLEAARKVYEDNQKIGNKTAQVSASSELAGYGRTLFADENMRRKYDNSLAMRVYEEIENSVKTLLQVEKTLYAESVAKLLDLARTRKLNLDEAERRIRVKAREMGAAIEVPNVQSIKDQRLCPDCNLLNSTGSKNCKSCGTPLEITCPDCGKLMPTEYTACTECGFPIGNLVLIRDLMSDSTALLNRRQGAEAIERLQLAKQAWTTTGRRALQDDMTKQIDQALNHARELWQNELDRLNNLRRAVDKHQFYAARDIVRQIQQDGMQVSASDIGKIETAIQRAEQQVRQAETIRNVDDKVQAYLQILRDCADCAAAKQALASTPPVAPQGVTAQIGGEIVSLQWQPSSSNGVRYAIIRKPKSPPVSASDGEQLNTVSGLRFDDTTPEIGLPVYYAIYADREGVLSNEAALLSKPVLIKRGIESSSLTARIDNQQVHLNWTPPPNVTRVEVRRSLNGMIGSASDGDAVRVIDKTQAVDTGLTNGTTYHYGIFCVFTDIQGNPVISDGAFIDATPEEPPAALTDVNVETLQSIPSHIIRLSWSDVRKGRVVMLRSNRPPGFGQANVIAETQLALHGDVLYPTGNSLEVAVETVRVTYFTPTVLFQKMAYPGKTLDYASLEDMRNLKVLNQKVELQLRWDWPKNCQRGIVAYSYTQFPGVHDDGLTDVVRSEVTQGQYNVRGYYAIKSPLKRDYYITVLAIFTQDGQELVASGHSKGARGKASLASSMTVNYEIVRQRTFLGKGSLTLTVNVTGDGNLPELLLVAKQGALPMNKADGEVVLRLNSRGLTGTKTTLTETLSSHLERPQGFVRFFLEDDSLYDSKGGYVRITHPEQEKLRLF